mgnify:CR=1 FL=1
MDIRTIDIPEVPSDRRYWLIRTERGKYYRDFREKEFIALGWDYFSNLDDLKSASLALQVKEKLTGIFKKIYPTEKRPGLAINQMIKFVTDISIDDIVIIPSINSNEISIGIVTSTPYIEPPRVNNTSCLDITKPEYEECPFIKRIHVKWLTRIKKANVDLRLAKLLNARNTITQADFYAHFIDRSVHSLYYKSGNVHLTLQVEKKEDVTVDEFAELLSSIQGIVNTHYISDGRSPLVIKSRVESPGPIEIIGGAIVVALLAAVIGHLRYGGELSFKMPYIDAELSIKTDGSIGRKLQKLEEKNRHQEIILVETHRHKEKIAKINKAEAEKLKRSLKRLKIKPPKDLDK